MRSGRGRQRWSRPSIARLENSGGDRRRPAGDRPQRREVTLARARDGTQHLQDGWNQECVRDPLAFERFERFERFKRFEQRAGLDLPHQHVGGAVGQPDQEPANAADVK